MQYRVEIELRGGVRARSPLPYGGATPFHDDVDGNGRLMDRGGDQPLGERAQQPGFARTSFCYDEVDCLAEILAP